MSTIYLDMDGVIADFFGGIQKLYQVDHWKSIQHRDGVFVELRNTDFFDTLDTFYKMHYEHSAIISSCISSEIVRHVRKVSGGDWGICSSPLQGDEFNSAYWKRVWLERRGFMPEVEKCIFTRDKPKYAWNRLTRLPNILIDDKPSNIKNWNDAGGIGIRFQANEDDLDEYLLPELEKAVEQTRNR